MDVDVGISVSKGYLLMVMKCELLRTAVELKRKSNSWVEKTAKWAPYM